MSGRAIDVLNGAHDMTAEVLNSTITFASFIPHRIEAVENVASRMAFTVFYSPLATRHSPLATPTPALTAGTPQSGIPALTASTKGHKATHHRAPPSLRDTF